MDLDEIFAGLKPVEQIALHAFRNSQTPQRPATDQEAWILFGLMAALEAGKVLRASSIWSDTGDVEMKTDGTPLMTIEKSVESMVYGTLEGFGLEAATLGEELGGELPSKGHAVVVDPVDGTWAYLSDTGTAATTISVFRDGEPFLGVVGNHTAAEVGYALRGERARLLRLSCYGEADDAMPLPFGDVDSAKVLVNVHPARQAREFVGNLYSAWTEDRIHLVRSPAGSPAWGLLEAAKGHVTYVNLWGERPSEPWDLAAGVLVVRAAGGDVVGRDGKPINAVQHAGPFVAGVSAESRSIVASMIV